MPPTSLTASVDRIEGRIAVLEGDDGRHFEVPVRDLLEKPVEGLIYVAPLDASGEPQWKLAVVDRAEGERRRKDSKRRMDDLRKRDRGGDIEL